MAVLVARQNSNKTSAKKFSRQSSVPCENRTSKKVQFSRQASVPVDYNKCPKDNHTNRQLLDLSDVIIKITAFKRQYSAATEDTNNNEIRETRMEGVQYTETLAIATYTRQLSQDVRQSGQAVRHPSQELGKLSQDVRNPSQELRLLNQDAIDSIQDLRHSSQDLKHSRQDIRISSQDIRHSSQDPRHSSQDVRLSSQDLSYSSQTARDRIQDIRHPGQDLKQLSHDVRHQSQGIARQQSQISDIQAFNRQTSYPVELTKKFKHKTRKRIGKLLKGIFTCSVFDVDKDQHAQYFRDVHHTKPSNVALNVTVLEAKGLASGKNGPGEPYCVLAVCRPSSPHQSPRSSPVPRRKHGSVEHGDLKKTQSSRAARWHEHFDIDVKDLASEDLHVMILNNEGQDDLPSRSSGVKGLFKQLKNHKNSQFFYGQVRIPVRDIPASGCERWFTLFTGKPPVPAGQIKLRLELAVRQAPTSSDQLLSAAESDLCSLEDFYAMVHRLYMHALVHEDEGRVQRFRELPEQSRNVLHQFAVQNRFTKLHRILMELIVLLDLLTGIQQVHVDEKIIKDAVVSLEMEWFQVTGGKADKGVISENQFFMFNKSATEYVSQMIRGLKESNAVPKLFPPAQIKLADINSKVSVAVSLLNLHLWNSTDRARKDASGLLAERIQDDVRVWITEKLTNTDLAGSKDPDLAETRHLVQIVQETETALTPIFSIASYFTRLSVDYYKTAALAADKIIGNISQQLMLRMDRYQVRYHKFTVNIRDSSTVTLQLYFVLRELFNVIRSSVNHRELFKVTVARYQTWFEHAVMFWLQTFREECVRRMQKALEIEKDIVQVTSLVKYSKSSVDVVSCFSKITSEWKQIDFHDADIAILGVTKITDTICDGARAYAEQVHLILETNGYYDFNDDEVFDVTDQLCITLNNICHIQKFLYDLRDLLNWDIVCENMSIKHENSKVGENSLRVLEELVDSASEDILARGRFLMCNITEKMSVDIRRLTKRFTQKHPEKKSSVDPLLGYLDTSLDILYEKLEAIIFPIMLEQIWYVLLYAFKDTLMHGQSTTYYQYMANHLETLKQYVLRGTDEAGTECSLYEGIVEELRANAMTTEQLQLLYYQQLCDKKPETPGVYFGHLAVKMAYQYQDDARVTMVIEVDSADHLPGMHKDNSSSPYISVRLSPGSRFRGCNEQKTQVVKGSTEPVYNTLFLYPDLDEESFLSKGSVAIFTAWSKESVLPNDFLGELVIPLAHSRQMNSKQSIDDIAAMILPLQRPTEPMDGPYQVLVERARYEKHAKAIVKKRRETTGWETVNPIQVALCKMMGKKTEVEGQKYGPCIS